MHRTYLSDFQEPGSLFPIQHSRELIGTERIAPHGGPLSVCGVTEFFMPPGARAVGATAGPLAGPFEAPR